MSNTLHADARGDKSWRWADNKTNLECLHKRCCASYNRAVLEVVGDAKRWALADPAPAPQLAWRQRFSADLEVDPSVVLSESMGWVAPYNLMLHRAFRVVNQGVVLAVGDSVAAGGDAWIFADKCYIMAELVPCQMKKR